MAALSKVGVRACYVSQEQEDKCVKEGVVMGLYQLVYVLYTRVVARKQNLEESSHQ